MQEMKGYRGINQAAMDGAGKTLGPCNIEPKQGQVIDQMESQVKSIAELMGAINNLQEKIGPTLSSCGPTGEPCEKEPHLQCGLAEIIRVNNRKIYVAIGIINDMTQRCEL